MQGRAKEKESKISKANKIERKEREKKSKKIKRGKMKISAARKMRRNKYRVDCRIYRLEKGDARARIVCAAQHAVPWSGCSRAKSQL